jgi:hypothetical protein
MRSRIQFVSGLVIAAMMAGMVMAAAEAAKKDDGAKKESAPKAKHYRGMLAAKPADAAANVLATLTVKGREDKEVVYSVLATDELVVGKIAELLAKGEKVSITGELSADGKSITASEAVAAPAKKTGDKAKGPKHEKKAEDAVPAAK